MFLIAKRKCATTRRGCPSASFRRALRACCANRGGCSSSPAFLYLALILAPIRQRDPGWSFSGTGAPIANRGGVVGAWLSDLLLYLFGVLGVVVGRRRRRAGRRRLSPHRASGARKRSSVRARRRRVSRWCCSSSAALEAHPLWQLARRRCRSRPAARSAMRSGRASRAASASTARRCCCSRCSPSDSSLLFGVSWLRVMERIGAGVEALIARVRRRREEALDRRIGDAARAERELAIEHVREDDVDARAVRRRARGDRRPEIGARDAREAAAAVHRHARFAAAAAVAARGRAAGARRRSAPKRSSSRRA